MTTQTHWTEYLFEVGSPILAMGREVLAKQLELAAYEKQLLAAVRQHWSAKEIHAAQVQAYEERKLQRKAAA